MKERVLNLLYRSFDQELSSEEQKELETALSSSPELQEAKKRIAAIRQMVKDEAVRSFKPFFSTRVMRSIRAVEEKSEDFFGSLIWSFRLVALVGAVAVVFLFAHNALESKNISLDSILAMPQLSLEETWELDILLEEEKR